MSQYVILIKTALTPNVVIDPFRLMVPGAFKDGHFTDDYGAPVTLYALTTTSHPPTGLATLQNYCPVKLEIVHYVHTRLQTDYLLRTLQIKFRPRLLHGFWYALDNSEVELIKSLTEANFSSMIGLIHQQLKKPDMTPQEGADFVKEQIAKAEAATK